MMDIKELQSALATPEGLEFLKTITDPMSVKNKELLDELRELRASGEGAPSAEELQTLQDAKTKLEALEHKQLEEKGDYETLIAKMKEQASVGGVEKDNRIAELEKSLNGMIIGGTLQSALAKRGVLPEVMDVVTNFLTGDVQVIDGKPVVGSLTLDQYVEQWSKTPQAKYFIGSGSTGGDAGGGQGGGEDEWEVHFKPASANRTKQAMLKKQDPDAYNRLIAKYPPVRTQGMQPSGPI